MARTTEYKSFFLILSDAKEKYSLSFEEIPSRLSDVNTKYSELSSAISERKEKAARLEKIATYYDIYKATKVINSHFQSAKNKEAYFQSHESQLMAYDEAELQLAFLGVGLNKIDSNFANQIKDKLSSYKKEIEDLQSELNLLKQEQTDLINWQKDIDIYMGNAEQNSKKKEKEI